MGRLGTDAVPLCRSSNVDALDYWRCTYGLAVYPMEMRSRFVRILTRLIDKHIAAFSGCDLARDEVALIDAYKLLEP